MSITFGNVPHPSVEIRDIPGTVNTAWDNLGKRTIRGVVLHRMEGSLWGTDRYFRTGGEGGGAWRARTDYGVGVEAMDGSTNAGKLLRWTDPNGMMSPWANGKLASAYGDGLLFYNKYGAVGVNRDLVSLEISGQATTPLDPMSRRKIAELIAYWADQYRIQWDSFPMIPSENRSFVIWHQEFTIGTGKKCPYSVVMTETPAIINDVKDIMRTYQTKNAPAPVVSPSPISADTISSMVDGGQAITLGVITLHAVEDTKRYRFADPAAAEITSIPTIKAGEELKCRFAVVGSDRRLWYVLDDWSRVQAKDVM